MRIAIRRADVGTDLVEAEGGRDLLVRTDWDLLHTHAGGTVDDRGYSSLLRHCPRGNTGAFSRPRRIRFFRPNYRLRRSAGGTMHPCLRPLLRQPRPSRSST